MSVARQVELQALLIPPLAARSGLGEVRAIVIALAEIIARLDRILGYIEGDDDEEETEAPDA